MSPYPPNARWRSRAARRSLALCAALLALAPVASADASGAGLPTPGQLWVFDPADEENTIVLTYDPQGEQFLISDESGIEPGLGCHPMGSQVACPDPDALVTKIHIVLRGGNDVFTVGGETGEPLPPQISETIVGGGDGSDVVVGGNGRNRILGKRGRDVLAGGDRDDKLVGGRGRDGLIGFGGDDLIQGGQGSDAIFAFGGDDILRGEAGGDTLIGGRGDDRLLGGPKHDLIEAGKGIDSLFGNAGPDRLLAVDGIRDARINCGPGSKDKFERDPFDPRARSC